MAPQQMQTDASRERSQATWAISYMPGYGVKTQQKRQGIV